MKNRDILEIERKKIKKSRSINRKLKTRDAINEQPHTEDKTNTLKRRNNNLYNFFFQWSLKLWVVKNELNFSPKKNIHQELNVGRKIISEKIKIKTWNQM